MSPGRPRRPPTRVASALFGPRVIDVDDLDLALEAARIGADVIRPRHVRSVEYKGTVDPVTNADTEAQERIISVLAHHRPADAILAEEHPGVAGATGRWWLIDPLDGTVNFVHGIPHVAVSIALYEDGQPLVGVVIDVFHREEFSSVTGSGAWLDGRLLEVSDNAFDSSLVGTGFPYDRRERAQELGAVVGTVLAHVQGLRRMGTASLDLAWVAAGRLDGFWEIGLKPWDVAAGLILVREAGGVATNLDGAPSTPFDSHFVVSNGIAHEPLRSLLASVMADR